MGIETLYALFTHIRPLRHVIRKDAKGKQVHDGMALGRPQTKLNVGPPPKRELLIDAPQCGI